VGGPIEIWGGLECTVARIGNAYFDQSERTGHDARLDDLDRFASLGLRALRYPVLWERAPQWEWADERLGRLRELGVRPIVGLVHHGSGPPTTSLLDPEFPQKLAAYAREVAERYPWVEEWTPVNEPLTTARFSCLYGFWYPHTREALPFARALLNQVKAVVLAMRAIREVNPDARLVQTDDLGKTHSTPKLHYQRDHENERRWATWDLLCGRPAPVRDWFAYIGVEEQELAWFEENPCPPDVIGINHYLSSERFLDDRLERYPEHLHGSNGIDRYVDELAPRILGPGADGPAVLLREAWERYRLPLAVTEVHNGRYREEQLRWYDEVWRAALAARDSGADVRAVAVWSLLGTAGWSTMLTDGLDDYEVGVFDARGPEPRPTAIARMTRALATDGGFEHPTLRAPGWWRREDRFWYPPEGQVARAPASDAPPVLVTGATGTLGQAFGRLCRVRGLTHVLTDRAELDAADPAAVRAALARHRPWAVVNTTGFVRVDDAELEAERCRRENAAGAAVLARECSRLGLPFVTFSSDLVFGGEKQQPYVESDPVAPLSVYGETKADAERETLAAHPDALVVRTSAFFGPWDEWNFAHAALRDLAAGRSFAAPDDLTVSPTYVPDLVDETLDLLIDEEHGIWHLANRGEVTWAEFAALVATAAGIGDARVEPRPAASFGFLAPRPAYSVLGSERGALLEPLELAVSRFVAARAATYDSTFSETRSGDTLVAD
jgi:dTDP-4-dehydrorhamnose reductase